MQDFISRFGPKENNSVWRPGSCHAIRNILKTQIFLLYFYRKWIDGIKIPHPLHYNDHWNVRTLWKSSLTSMGVLPVCKILAHICDLLQKAPLTLKGKRTNTTKKTFQYYKAVSSSHLSMLCPTYLNVCTSCCWKLCVNYGDTTIHLTERKSLRLCVVHTHLWPENPSVQGSEVSWGQNETPLPLKYLQKQYEHWHSEPHSASVKIRCSYPPDTHRTATEQQLHTVDNAAHALIIKLKAQLTTNKNEQRLKRKEKGSVVTLGTHICVSVNLELKIF